MIPPMTEGLVLTEGAVIPRIRGRFAVPYLWCASCPSTQDELRGSGLPEGAVAVAEHQTAGRGRSGRSWEDTPGRSVLVSVLLRPPLETPLPQLSLVAGLAVADSIEALTGLPTGIKWPNDVLLEDSKVAGILLEADGDAVICGIGINVRQTTAELPVATRVPATSLLCATGIAYDRATVLVTVLDTFERRYDTWRHDGIDPLLPELERRNVLRGRRARSGAVEGLVGTLAADGRIVLELDDGSTRLVGSGELEL
jgi:BirA family biotin operon repressor/biotin-[acetyl-CoA-carboxylase] ligase